MKIFNQENAIARNIVTSTKGEQKSTCIDVPHCTCSHLATKAKVAFEREGETELTIGIKKARKKEKERKKERGERERENERKTILYIYFTSVVILLSAK